MLLLDTPSVDEIVERLRTHHPESLKGIEEADIKAAKYLENLGLRLLVDFKLSTAMALVWLTIPSVLQEDGTRTPKYIN